MITASGVDAELSLVLEGTGQINEVNIINSGNGYDADNPPQIRVSHPQQYKKTRYWITEYKEATGQVTIHHTLTTSERYTYICGLSLIHI